MPEVTPVKVYQTLIDLYRSASQAVRDRAPSRFVILKAITQAYLLGLEHGSTPNVDLAEIRQHIDRQTYVEPR